VSVPLGLVSIATYITHAPGASNQPLSIRRVTWNIAVATEGWPVPCQTGLCCPSKVVSGPFPDLLGNSELSSINNPLSDINQLCIGLRGRGILQQAGGLDLNASLLGRIISKTNCKIRSMETFSVLNTIYQRLSRQHQELKPVRLNRSSLKSQQWTEKCLWGNEQSVYDAFS
jgi:hypothetical protein